MRVLAYTSYLLMTLGLFLEAPLRGNSAPDPVLPRNSLTEKQFSSSPSLENRYSMIFTILNTQNFLDTLEGPFTLFIPTNAALLQLSPATLREFSLPENKDKLSRLISNHIVKKQLLREDFEKFNNKEIKSLGGKNLTLKSENNVFTIDGAHILRVEPAGEDGVLYVIDRVLWP